MTVGGADEESEESQAVRVAALREDEGTETLGSGSEGGTTGGGV